MINALKAALLFCEIDQIESRRALAGILFEFIPGGLRIVSTNAIYGIVIEVEAAHGNTPGDSIVIYREEVVQLLKHLQEQTETITWAVTGGELLVITSDEVRHTPGLGLEYMKWKQGFQLDSVEPVAETHIYNPDLLITICQAFKYLLGKNRAIQYTAGSQLLRAVFNIPPSHLKPGILSAQAVIMPIRENAL